MDGVSDRLKALDDLLRDGRSRSDAETKCIERQVKDLETGHKRGLVWREDAARHVCEGLFPNLRLWKGAAGKRFKLEPWQEHCVIAPLFGWWRETPSGLRRRFNIAYVEIPRKNGKTTLAAGVALQGLMADGEPGAMCYSAATKLDQAQLVFNDAKNMVSRSPLLMRHVELKANALVCPRHNSSLKALSADAHTLHGLDIHRAIIDELHSHKTRDLWDVIQTGTPARRNPMVFVITTAGYDRSTICWEQHEYTKSVLSGEVVDDSYFGFIAAANPEDDPFDPETWSKANPNLGISFPVDYMEKESVRAKSSPSYENTFRRLHLNQWTEQAIRWLPMHEWDAAREDYGESDLIGQECFGGLDIASTRDVTAFVLVFPTEGGGYRLLPYYWVPEEVNERAERDRRQVTNWASRGLIKKTPGNVADYDIIRSDILELTRRFNVRSIAFDNWQAMETSQHLMNAGVDMIEFRQTIGNFAEPTKAFERLLLSGKMRHNGCPVLRWMAGNVAVWMDANANMRPDKKNSADKIDGIVASIMGLAQAMADDHQEAGFQVLW